MKYIELLKQTETEIKEGQLIHQDKQSSLALQQAVVETEYQLEEAKAKLLELKRTFPLPVSKIVEQISKVEGYERGLEALTALQKELF